MTLLNRRGTRVLAAVAVALLITACRPGAEQRNLVLITLDTTRADRLGCYGYEGGSTPSIDSLAEQGTVFERAFTPAPITGPSHASILSGTYPPFHGMRDNGLSVLSDELPSMAELFRAAGYRTAGIVAAYPVKGSFGFNRGFDYFSDNFDASSRSVIASNLPSVGVARRQGEIISREFEAWLARQSGGPFFAWLHYYDPHLPHEPPPEFLSLFPDRPYDAEIAYMDDCIGSVIRAVERAGQLDSTGFVVVADHGEGLSDHEEKTHALLAYNSTMHVPLVVTLPWIQKQARRIDGMVTTVDILPTVVEAFELGQGEVFGHGVSLMPALRAEGPVELPERSLYFESIFPYYHFRWGTLHGVIKDGWKYIKGPDDELYDLEEDFAELDPIQAADVRATLNDELETLKLHVASGRPDVGEGMTSRETLERLQALGYAGGGAKQNEDVDYLDLEGMPIPRENMQVWQEYDDLLGKLRQGRPAAAIEPGRRLIESHPEHKDARLVMASAYAMIRSFDRADALYDELLDQYDDLDVLYPAARYFLEIRGDFLRSRSCLERYLAQAPEDHEALALLAVTYERSDDPVRAEEIYRETLIINPESRNALIGLGILRDRVHGDRDQAHVLLSKAVDDYPFDPVTNFNLGVLLIRQGTTAEGLDLLKRASAFAPDGVFAPAHLALARYHLAQDDSEAARRYLQDVARATGNPAELAQAQKMLAELDGTSTSF